MKYHTIRILIFIFFLLPPSVFGFYEDRDSTLLIPIDSSKKGIDLIAVGGLGITFGSIGEWENHFSPGPAFALGLEIPFTSAHMCSLELYEHFWINETKHELGYVEHDYIKIAKDVYSQMGLSASFKLYILSKTSKFRISLHLGWLFLSPNPDYTGLDMGLGLYYVINEKWDISLSRRMLINIFGIRMGGGSIYISPFLLMLNICYKFNLVL